MPGERAGLSEGHAANFAREWAQIDVSLVMHDQACAFHERLVAGIAFGVAVEALEVRLAGLVAVIVRDGDAELAVGVAWQYFESRVSLPAGDGGFACCEPACVLMVGLLLHHRLRLLSALIEHHASEAPAASLRSRLKGCSLDMENGCVWKAIPGSV